MSNFPRLDETGLNTLLNKIATDVTGQLDDLETTEKSSLVGAINESRSKTTTLPTASSDYVGKVYQYIGNTTSNYTHGYFYECKENSGVYSWVRVDVQPGGGSGGGHTIIDSDGNIMPQRGKLQFEGLLVEDDSANGVTVVKNKPNFLKQWLIRGGINPNDYETIDDVLADEEAVRKLMTIHDAVDYLATSYDELAWAVINSDICAKWINLRDYALDTLYANQYFKDMMDEADKYFYGEWALVGQVPTMTSNTAPYGEAFMSNPSASDPAYKIFDANTSSIAKCASESQACYIGYHFTSPVSIRKVSFSISTSKSAKRDIIIQYSDDGTTYHDALSTSWEGYTDSQGLNSFVFDVPDCGSHAYWRMYNAKQYSSGIQSTMLSVGSELQFYAWAPKGNVPVMTSNTAPYGTASAYQVFDRSYSTTASGTDFSYQFVNPVCVRDFVCKNSSRADITGGTLQGSNDGSTWTSISTPASNTTYYLYYRVHFGSSKTVAEVQFYGREMKVSVPAMTSNTSPYGEASCSSTYSSNFSAWKGFDGINANGDGWHPSSSDTNAWLKYKFERPVIIKKMIGFLSARASQTTDIQYDILGSNDDSGYTKIGEFYILSYMAFYTSDFPDNNAEYQYYKIMRNGGTASVSAGNGTTFNLFGFDYSEYDWDAEHPRHYIYDHGVEPNEEVIIVAGTGTISQKQPNNIYIQGKVNAAVAERAGAGAYLDITPYKLLRMAMYDRLYAPSGLYLAVTDTTVTSGTVANRAISSADPDAPCNFGLDVSSVNQLCYATVNTASGTTNPQYINIAELWLE